MENFHLGKLSLKTIAIRVRCLLYTSDAADD